jgi:glycosyltransferase involved in cell wall biosynthesis
MNQVQSLITIITATYNAELFLEESINSVISQVYQPKEYIIIDGGSTDRTGQIIDKYSTHITHYISEKDNGIYEAWNKGLKLAKGEWITFLGADDFFYDKNVLLNVAAHLREAKYKGVNYVYGKIHHVSRDTLQFIREVGTPWDEIKDKLLDNMQLGHCASFHHINLFKNHGQFDTSFKIAGDYEFLLREFKGSQNEAIFIDDIIIAIMRVGGISENWSSNFKRIRECSRARKVNGISNFSWSMFIWRIKSIILSISRLLLGVRITKALFGIYKNLKKRVTS